MGEAKYDVVKFVDNGFELEVNVSPSEETVWLTQEQMSLLFDTTKQNVSLHISNILRENELDNRTVKEYFTVQKEGKREVRRTIRLYSLDMIISVGYRLKSKRGIMFRQWANSVLKQYLLRGYAIDTSRVVVTQENYLNLVSVVNRIDCNQDKLTQRVEKLEQKYLDIKNMLFFKGQLFDAFSCIAEIIGRAVNSVILIDGYVDTGTLDLLSKKKTGVEVNICTYGKTCKLTDKEISDFNLQYGKLTVQYSEEFHDRFLILDGKELYHIGASIKDAGKKAFEISVIDDETQLKSIIARL